MTDDLVKRLRFTEFSFEPPLKAVDLMDQAADRIEELQKLCEELRLSHWDTSERLRKISKLAGEKKDE
jgi:hypothetical protein